MVTAGVLVLILPLKMIFYFLVFTRFRLRARTSFNTTMNLANYSEFGLIVCSLAVAGGKIDQQWLVVLAIALSISLIISSPLNRHSDLIFETMEKFLKKFESQTRHQEEQPYKHGKWHIGIIGMGRVGTGAYDMFKDRFGDVIIGLDFNPETVARQHTQGRNVQLGDVTDPDFWQRLPRTDSTFQLIVLAIDDFESKLHATKALKKRGYPGNIAAVAHFDDEVQPLLDAGLDTVFNMYSEAGAGLAAHICDTLQTSCSPVKKMEQPHNKTTKTSHEPKQ